MHIEYIKIQTGKDRIHPTNFLNYFKDQRNKYMYRFEYKNFSLTEENLDKCIDKYVIENELIKECVVYNGFKAYRLTSNDGTAIEITFEHKTKSIYLDTDIDICKEKGLKIITFLSKENLFRLEYPGCPSSVKDCDEEMTKYLASVISKKEQPNFPIVYLSRQDYHSYAGNIDEHSLATKLQGIAHVVIESSDTVLDELRRAISSKKFRPPSKGEIGIYYPDGSHNIITPNNRTSSSIYNHESNIIHFVIDAVTKNAKMSRPTFDKILFGKMCSQPKNIIATQNQDSLKENLNSERRVNSELKKENVELRLENDRLKSDLKFANSKAKEINSLRIPDEEGREQEFYDLIVASVDAYNDMLPDNKKRAKTLCKAFLSLNPPTDYEKNMLEELSRPFKSESEREATFKKYNIHIERSKKHTVYRYMGITQPFACTPGDWRTEKNQLSNIKLAFCVQ